MYDVMKMFWGKIRGEKQKQLVADGLKTDTRYLFAKVFTEEVIKELEGRGYDITTLKFQIKKRENPPTD